MAVLTYQSKSKLKKALRITLVVVGALALLALLRFIYVGRYLVYNEDGVQLQQSAETLNAAEPQGKPAEEFALIREGQTQQLGENASQISGFYLTASQLMDASVRDQLSPLPGGCNTLLLDVKTATGKTLYPSALGSEPAASDVQTIADWIVNLKKTSHVTLVARIPAYRDSAVALSDYSMALPISGGALWMDANGSYCLDPASEKTVNFLLDTAKELSALGFDEIVFDGFDFPYSPNIVYSGNGQQAAIDAAQTISQQLKAKGIGVSFGSASKDLLALSDHAWVHAGGGTLVSELARQYVDYLPAGESGLVFLTASKDTRFSSYGVLTPFEQ